MLDSRSLHDATGLDFWRVQRFCVGVHKHRSASREAPPLATSGTDQLTYPESTGGSCCATLTKQSQRGHSQRNLAPTQPPPPPNTDQHTHACAYATTRPGRSQTHTGPAPTATPTGGSMCMWYMRCGEVPPASGLHQYRSQCFEDAEVTLAKMQCSCWGDVMV